MTGFRRFAILAREAIADAVRRRAVTAIAAVSLLSLLLIEGCTECAGGGFVVNGREMALPQVAGAAGLLTFAILSAWCIALAGVLAADHLVQTLDDGSATLCLARPVGRTSFALARLMGALAIALGTGAVLLGATAGLLHARSGLPLGPAVGAALAFGLGALAMSGLAMTLSLFVARIANVLLVFASVGIVAVANGLSLAGQGPEGWLGWVDRLGPPWTSSVVWMLAPWIPQLELAGDPVDVLARALAWAGLSVAALGLAFDRVELGRAAP